MPRGHRGPAHTSRHRAVEVPVGRQRARRRGAELEDSEREVSRTRGKERRRWTVAVAVLAVTADAARVVDLAPEREDLRATRDGHGRGADRLRLEHLAPGAAVGPELLDVADEPDQLVGGEHEGRARQRGRMIAESPEIDD